MTDDALTALEAQHPCHDPACTAQGCVSRRAITAHARELRAVLRVAQYELARDACHGGACDCQACAETRHPLGSGS